MPLQMIETADPLTNIIHFRTSVVYEMMLSLQSLVKQDRHHEWVTAARAAMRPGFWQRLNAIYKPFYDGAIFFELAVDYPDHDDVPGFLDYVRQMTQDEFVFYLAGRLIRREEVSDVRFDADLLRDKAAEEAGEPCWCLKSPIEDILGDVPAFQSELTAVWEIYWNDFMRYRMDELRPHWEHALDEKQNLLARLGGEGLWEHVVGSNHMPPPLPSDHPVMEIVFVPIYLMVSKPVFLFYGYGNITVLFDSERTEARIAEISRGKEQALEAFKALSDPSRLEVLRTIALGKGDMHGKKIAAKLNLSPSAVSRHLAQLKDAGLIVEESQDNRTITYTVQKDTISGLPEKLFDYLYH